MSLTDVNPGKSGFLSDCTSKAMFLDSSCRQTYMLPTVALALLATGLCRPVPCSATRAKRCEQEGTQVIRQITVCL